MNTRKPKLLVLDDREGEIGRSPALETMRTMAEVHVLGQPLSETPDDLVRDARFIVAVRERTRIDVAVLDRMPHLEMILQTGGHAYHIDLEEAAEREIVVPLWRENAACEAAVRELTIGLMIAALRRVPEAVRDTDAGNWTQNMGGTLRGRRLGILGLGLQGRAVARLARAFDMDVVASVSESGNARSVDGIPRIPLDELLATSDVVSVHLRLSERSRGYLSRERLRAMKPGSVLINTARGAIVDPDALAEVLSNGPLRAAGLDVFAHEPLPADSPLRRLPNVVLTPHIGWVVAEAFAEFAQGATDQLTDYLQGKLPESELAFAPRRRQVPGHLGGVAV
ncbi:NAD(P)-dependent oxidoreductase [Streptomyces sp. NPDC051217]|uniref:NAD(P)-dependent oxidoreductase n=1 Tax=Streptomyces sp. NPDC051217 TaxID=3365644 RepID=UPI003791EC1B